MSGTEPLPRPHIVHLAATSYADGRRVGVSIEVGDATAPCNLDVEIRALDGRALGAMFVVESREPHIELTIHYRGGLPASEEELRVHATLLVGDVEMDSASAAYTDRGASV